MIVHHRVNFQFAVFWDAFCPHGTRGCHLNLLILSASQCIKYKFEDTCSAWQFPNVLKFILNPIYCPESIFWDLTPSLLNTRFAEHLQRKFLGISTVKNFFGQNTLNKRTSLLQKVGRVSTEFAIWKSLTNLRLKQEIPDLTRRTHQNTLFIFQFTLT